MLRLGLGDVDVRWFGWWGQRAEIGVLSALWQAYPATRKASARRLTFKVQRFGFSALFVASER